jgi:hypothetical protein
MNNQRIARELLAVARDLTAKATSWRDVQNAMRGAKRILDTRLSGPKSKEALRLWEGLTQDLDPRDQNKAQIAIIEAQDTELSPVMAKRLQSLWNVLLDYRSDLAIRRRGGKRIHVHDETVKYVQVKNGEWGIAAHGGLLNVYSMPEKWLYALKNVFNYPGQKAEKLYKELGGWD